MTIAKNKVVQMHYTLKNDTGDILDTSEGQAPLVYIHGMGSLIPGLEKALEGKKTGDQVKVSIPPAEAYGDFEEGFIQQVPLAEFPKGSQVQLGDQFEMESPEGYRVATVTKLDDSHATIDLNHPLAGQTLNFDVTIGDVRDATEEELTHGHVHGEGGHHH